MMPALRYARLVGCVHPASQAKLHTCPPLRDKPEKLVKIRPARKFPKVYTRTGDAGTSALFTGERRPKTDLIFEALGSTDELSSHIGLAMEFAQRKNHPYTCQLQRVQCILQDIGSVIATPHSSARDSHLNKLRFNIRHVEELEEWIDQYSEELPPLENFILPGGGVTSAQIHVARAVCRRTERAVTAILGEKEHDPGVQKYLNRLSDFLFTIARLAARLDGEEETVYTRPAEGSSYIQSHQDGHWKKQK